MININCLYTIYALTRKTCSLVRWFCKYNRYVIPSISRCSWQPTDIYKYGYTTIADIYMAAKEITIGHYLSHFVCLKMVATVNRKI